MSARTVITISPTQPPTADLHPWGDADITLAPDVTIRTPGGADDTAVAAWFRALAAAATEAADWHEQDAATEQTGEQVTV